MLPKDLQPMLRERRVASGCQFSGHTQSREARSVNRRELQIPAHLHGGDVPPGKIIKRQNPDRKIPQKRLGKAHLKDGSGVADAESPCSAIEAIHRRLLAGRPNPSGFVACA